MFLPYQCFHIHLFGICVRDGSFFLLCFFFCSHCGGLWSRFNTQFEQEKKDTAKKTRTSETNENLELVLAGTHTHTQIYIMIRICPVILSSVCVKSPEMRTLDENI